MFLPTINGSHCDRTREQEVTGSARLIFFPRIDDSHCDRIHSSLTTIHCFDIGCEGAASGLEEILCGILVNQSFENNVGKGENARNEQFLLFPQCFLPIRRTFYGFH